MDKSTWASILRWVSYLLDKIIYDVFKFLYDVFWEVANVSILSSDMIKSFASRVYVLVGVVMLFKLAFSLVNMFINPDAFSDESKGFGKLVQRAMIALALLIALPSVFTMASRLQGVILKSNIIGDLILGKNVKTDFSDEKAGEEMTIQIYSCFLSGDGVDTSSLDAMLKLDINDSSGGVYKYDYQYFVAPLAGVFAIIILLNFVIDIAIRTVKLAFLQLISPIPVVLYVDPKGAEGSLSKYITTYLKVYAGLFIRIAALYFVFYLISAMTENGFTLYSNTCPIDPATGAPATDCIHEVKNWLMKPVIILGLFYFAKEIPKMLEDILGIKFDGDFSMTPWKRYSDAAKSLTAPAIKTVGTGIGLAAAGTTLARSLAQGNGIRQSLTNTADSFKNRRFGTPQDTEERNNRRAARHQLKNEDNVRDLAEKVTSNGADPTGQKYFSEDYYNSMRSVDGAKDALKNAEAEEVLATQRQSRLTNGYTQKMDAAKEKMQTLPVGSAERAKAYQEMVKYKKDMDAANEDVVAKRQGVKDATKALEGVKKDHELKRAADKRGREVEDALEFVKYHPIA